MESRQLAIHDAEADRQFRALARRLALDPENVWVGGYVDEVWARGRYLLEQYDVKGKRILEFGCHIGATAIVLAMLGAHVTALDVSSSYVELAYINARRYGVADRIQFIHAPNARRLPFAAETFALVTCMSVFEYVHPAVLPLVQKEIDRILQPAGLILIAGTSSRLWPREVHSRRWFVNYLPHFLHRLGRFTIQTPRGVSPWRLRYGFGDYSNHDLQDGGKAYRTARASMGHTPATLVALKGAHCLLSVFGLSVGLCTPNISLVLQKRP